MRKLILFAMVIALLMSAVSVYAAPPPDGPPGLEKAIAAQEKNNPRLLTTAGVVGTAVGLGDDGNAVIKVFTESKGIARLPAFLDGIPVVEQVTGKIMALKRPPTRNTAPVVTIKNPEDGSPFNSNSTILFEGTAIDDKDGDISYKLIWTSSIDGSIGTGASFTDTLSDGTHTITASATNSKRKTGKDTVTITVGGSVPSPSKTTDFWARPVPIGISTGNYQDVSAGTIACRVKDDSGNVYALSNTHVYAPQDFDGQTEIDDIVTQPGLYDVASHTYNDDLYLGTLAAYKPIDGFILAFNDIDAAIASTDINTLGNSTPDGLGGYGIPNKVTVTAALNMPVQKFGRTTQLTRGKITGINATVVVGYADNWYAWFTGQIIVDTTSAFILPGDSGSLMVTDNDSCNPVGLLFAGNAAGTYSIANPIDAVLDYFDVTIDGKD